MKQKTTILIWEQQTQNIKATVMIKPLAAVITMCGNVSYD
jgi:hypothetical protein